MLDKSGPDEEVSSVVVAVDALESTTIGGRGGTTPLEKEDDVIMGGSGVGRVAEEDSIVVAVVANCSCC